MLLFRIRLLGYSSRWSCPRWKFEIYSSYRKQFFHCFCPPKICSTVHPFSQSWRPLTALNHNSLGMWLDFGYFHCKNMHRCFTASPPNLTAVPHPAMEGEVQRRANVHSAEQKLDKRNYFPNVLVLEIIDIIWDNEKDLESRLSMVASSMSAYLVMEIFEILNSQRICGLRFFEWIWINSPHLNRNARICSLIVDNLGRLEDHESMLALLKKFSSNKICLTYEAFAFLPVLASANSSLKDSTTRVVEMLNKVSGSCQNSGIYALVEMFCKLDLFEMARHVIKITQNKESYYFLLIREKCRKGLIDDARDIIREMGEANCAPTARVYNCLLGSLYKNGLINEASKLLDGMKEIGILPDAITFEILINFFCFKGEMNTVQQLLDQMVSQGLKPRLETHIAIIKSLCAVEKNETAHKYVTGSGIIYKTSCNTLYSLLAKLYLENGDIMNARRTLLEMMDKGIKPNFQIYMKIVKQLIRTRRKYLVRALEHRHFQSVPSYRS